MDNLPSLVGGKHTNDAPFDFDLEYYATSPYFLRSCPMKISSSTNTSSASGSSGSSSAISSSGSNSVVNVSSSDSLHGGLTIEDVDGSVLTLSSPSTTTDVAHSLCVTVSAGNPPLPCLQY